MNTSIRSGSDEQLDAAIRSVFGDIVVATDQREGASINRRAATTAVGKRWLLVAASAILLVGFGGLIVVNQRDGTDNVARTTDDLASAPSSAIAPDTLPAPASSEPAASIAAVPEQDILSWQLATDIGSLARSSVESIVSNDNGFVATGMGFDDGRNQGRVWYSTDGITWLEPAFKTFDDKNVYGAAATNDAFYVLAATNSDRTPENEGEGTANLNDDQLYRSTDGSRWATVGNPGRAIMNIAAAGDTLLRQTTQDSVQWSSNGDDWFPSELPNDGEGISLLDLNSAGLIDGDVTYLRGFRTVSGADVFMIWKSLDEGRTWTELPAAPFGGFMVETPDGLLMNFAPDGEQCMQEQNDAVDQLGADGSGDGDLEDAFWRCAESLGTLRFDPGTNLWNLVDAIGPGPTPSLTTILRIGNTLVTPILEPDKALTVWTASLDATDWAADPTTTLDFIDNTGSPGTVAAAATDSTVVIASPDRLIDGRTVLLVGTID